MCRCANCQTMHQQEMIQNTGNKIKKRKLTTFSALVIWILVTGMPGKLFAQDAKVNARIDARQITVGDQVRLFIEADNNNGTGRLQWAVIPDTFNTLEVVERGKIDTSKQGDVTVYKQRLVITGFDSGVFNIPSFQFAVIPNSGNPYTVQTDSFPLTVQTVPVDTTKGFKGIKGIIYVKSSWRDYALQITGGLIVVALIAFIIIYFMRHKKVVIKPQGPPESLQAKTMRLLNELEAKQLWQKQQVKQYYVELTDIVRSYIEERFSTPAMELTTDELLYKAQFHKELQPYHDLLATILHTADLAKFAKAEPLPQEHIDAMEKAKQIVDRSKPVIVEAPVENPTEKTI